MESPTQARVLPQSEARAAKGVEILSALTKAGNGVVQINEFLLNETMVGNTGVLPTTSAGQCSCEPTMFAFNKLFSPPELCNHQ